MLFGDFEVVYKLSDGFKACEDGILPSEGMFPKEDFKGGLILMLFCIKIAERAGELVQIIKEDVNSLAELPFHCIACF